MPTNFPPSHKAVELQALQYVSGYIVKKIGNTCNYCKHSFLKSDVNAVNPHEDFTKFKEYNKKFRSLKYVNPNFLEKMKTTLSIIKFILNKDLHRVNLIKYIEKILMERIYFTDCFHDAKVKMGIFRYFIRVNLFNYCKQINSVLRGQDQRISPKNAPKSFLAAKKIFLNNRKRQLKNKKK